MTYDANELVDIAAGRKKSGLVLKNAEIVNVFTHDVCKSDIAIAGEMIAGIGHYEGLEEIDLDGRYAVPGLIDAHMHLESSMVMPSEFARAVVPRGTTTVIADPHEIANVAGLAGVRFLLDNTRDILLDVFIMLPSCVPATSFDDSGAIFSINDMEKLYNDARVLGLGEVMDFQGIVSGSQDLMQKIKLFSGKIIDGHAPGLTGIDLNAYAAAGIRTEHECSGADEMLEKLRLGFYILIREGSAARDLPALVKAVNPNNLRRCLFCTDDRQLEDIVEHGHIDNNVRLAVRNGIDPVSAITMATLNTAECYGLRDRGAIAPGYLADIVILDSLEEFKIHSVYRKGRPVTAKSGSPDNMIIPQNIENTINIKVVTADMFKIKIGNPFVNVIEIVHGSIVTRKTIKKVSVEKGEFKRITPNDPVKLAVIERHKASGRIGLGLLDKFGLREGAIASTISHDSHNIIVAGDNDEDMLAAINGINGNGGGITICSGGRAIKTLPLKIAGLISVKTYQEVYSILGEMLEIAHKMGIPDGMDPFMTLSFLALTVIPELRLTDRGLVDVVEGRFINLDAGSDKHFIL
ncbi:MAG: adenine deaminase [Ruminiclostridium sp.]|nr:adenine deaminase [Ruminiclostridium sp.]